jgi:hypothetical protein
MYSTKLLNKNIVEGGKYITINDEYKDPKANLFRQPKKGEKVPTPFIVKMNPVNQENGHFSKLTYNSSVFKETNLYISTQPLDKRVKGFGTRDASRRDEFTNAIRTAQYRESIRKEAVNLKVPNQLDQEDSLTRAMSASAAVSSSTFPYSLSATQYDIGRSQVTEFDPKSTRDRYYKFATNRDKEYGAYRPSSADFGDNAWRTEYRPPSHGPKAQIKNFFDRSHLKVSPP